MLSWLPPMREINPAKPRVLLVGPLPPPLGGISVHVARLQKLLQTKFEVWVIDPYGNNRQLRAANQVIQAGPPGLKLLPLFWLLLWRERMNLVHVHVSAMHRFVFVGLPLLWICGWVGVPALLTIHSGSFAATNHRRAHRWLIRQCLSRFVQIIAVTKELRLRLIREFACPADKIAVIPAFIPASAEPSPELTAWLDGCRRDGRRVVVASGFGRRHYRYQDLLAAVRIGGLSGQVAILLFVYNEVDQHYIHELRVQATGLVLRIERDRSPEVFCGALANCDLYVRTADRDGDCVAIREALAAGVRVLASDCVARPPAVTTFAVGDSAVISHRMIELLSAGRLIPMPTDDADDALQQIAERYNGCLGNLGIRTVEQSGQTNSG